MCGPSTSFPCQRWLSLILTILFPEADMLSQYEALALFIERAQAVKSEFQVTNSSAPAVAEICVRLDGLPLAIELAAARIKLFPSAGSPGRGWDNACRS